MRTKNWHFAASLSIVASKREILPECDSVVGAVSGRCLQLTLSILNQKRAFVFLQCCAVHNEYSAYGNWQMIKKIKFIVASTCAIGGGIVLASSWYRHGSFSPFQAAAIILLGQGLLWLCLPSFLKEYLENLAPDPRYSEVEWPDDWSDFVALAGMICGLFLVWR